MTKKSGTRLSRLNKHTTRRKRLLGKFRSLSERRVADSLKLKGIKYQYEVNRFEYFLRGRNKVICPNCGPISGLVRREYLPDFELSNGLFIEVKGRLTSKDRTKLAAVKQQHPGINLCILFDSNRYVEGSRKTGTDRKRYGDWANRVGIPWAVQDVPEEWLKYADTTDFSPTARTPKVIPVSSIDTPELNLTDKK
jgi:hypothetical protein